MIAMLLAALVLETAPSPAPREAGLYLGDVAVCSLEKPEVTAGFRTVVRAQKAPSFTMVLSEGARNFGISDLSLQLIERRLGGIILIDVPITATAVPGREGTYRIVPVGELQPDDYSFAISKDSKVVFFGCDFTTLP